MSTLINQSADASSTDLAQTVLREVMLSPKRDVSEPRLRATGVDVDMLEETFRQTINPYLDYLSGYQEIQTLDPQGNRRLGRWDSALKKTIPFESWKYLLERCGVSRRSRALTVLNGLYFYCHKDGFAPYVKLTVFLTRSGQWVVWYAQVAYHRSHEVESEQVASYGTVRDMWAALHELIPDDYKLDYHSGGHRGRPEFLPLLLDEGLRRVLNNTIATRQSHLNKMKAALADAEGRVEAVAFPRPR